MRITTWWTFGSSASTDYVKRGSRHTITCCISIETTSHRPRTASHRIAIILWSPSPSRHRRRDADAPAGGLGRVVLQSQGRRILQLITDGQHDHGVSSVNASSRQGTFCPLFCLLFVTAEEYGIRPGMWTVVGDPGLDIAQRSATSSPRSPPGCLTGLFPTFAVPESGVLEQFPSYVVVTPRR